MNVRQLAARVDPGQAVPHQRPAQARPPEKRDGSVFHGYLERAQRQAGSPRLSEHARHRIEQRGISMTETERHALGAAMQTLEAKGARDALLMRADAAFVVNVPSRTVVTAVGQEEMQDRVFTQIDSAMFV